MCSEKSIQAGFCPLTWRSRAHAAGGGADGLGQAESRADHGLAVDIGVILIAALRSLIAELKACLEGSKGVEAAVRDEGGGGA